MMRHPFLCVVAMFVATMCSIAAIQNTDWHKERTQRSAAAREARKVPHLYSKGADGCEIYAFEANGLGQFFTKCPNHTTQTTTTWQVCTQSGKTHTCRDESQTIEAR